MDDGFTSLITVVRSTSLTGSHGSIIDELEEVLSITSNQGDFFAVFSQCVKLVGIRGLDLFAGDVG